MRDARDTAVSVDGELYDISRVSAAFGLPVSTLRYYDDTGLAPCTTRRGTVRCYDRHALSRLAYLRLWHEDALLPLSASRDIADSDRLADRRQLIETQRQRLHDQITRMRRAAAVLTHMLNCETDNALECSYTGAYIDAVVDAALHGTPEPENFFPPVDSPRA